MNERKVTGKYFGRLPAFFHISTCFNKEFYQIIIVQQADKMITASFVEAIPILYPSIKTRANISPGIYFRHVITLA